MEPVDRLKEKKKERIGTEEMEEQVERGAAEMKVLDWIWKGQNDCPSHIDQCCDFRGARFLEANQNSGNNDLCILSTDNGKHQYLST